MPLDLMPYQEEGAAFLSLRARAGLHDEMGLGKTAQVIRAIDLRAAVRGFIICPASVRENWHLEFKKFALMPRRIVKAKNIHDLVAWARGRFDVIIMSYEHATKWREKITELAGIVEFVAVDEAHYVKNTETARTRAIVYDGNNDRVGLMSLGQVAYHITGTPMANDPIDIFPFLKWTGALGNMSKPSFERRYFETSETRHGSRHEVRPEMRSELTELIETHRIRRTKSLVGLQLPPIFITTMAVDGDTSEVAELLRKHPGLDRAILQALDKGGLQFLDAQHVATLRRLIGESKAIPFAEYLEDQLEAGLDKAVVMGVHKAALMSVRDHLIRKGYKSLLVNGETSEPQRVEAVRAFQNDADCRVFLGNIRAAGVGLTLTAASDIFMLESDWTPAGNAQAIMRVHRIGQVRNVSARFVILSGSFDEHVTDLVARKTKAIAEIEGEAMLSGPGAAA